MKYSLGARTTGVAQPSEPRADSRDGVAPSTAPPSKDGLADAIVGGGDGTSGGNKEEQANIAKLEAKRDAALDDLDFQTAQLVQKQLADLKRAIAAREGAEREAECEDHSDYTPWFVYSALLPSPTSGKGLYEVVHKVVMMRNGPSIDADLVGNLLQGLQVYGFPYEICGEPWLKLCEQVLPPPAGFELYLDVSAADDLWLLIDATGTQLPMGVLLKRVEDEERVENDERVEMEEKPSAASQDWRVIRKHVTIRKRPSTDTDVLAYRKELFDGYWIDADGKEVATILMDAILWVGGFTTRLERHKDGGFITTVSHWGELRAKPDDEGRLVWNDGDIWVRSSAALEESVSSSPKVRPPTTILVARHGERLDDAEWHYSQRAWIPTAERPWDPPLTPTGRLQGFALGLKACHQLARLGLPPLSLIFSSPYERCYETAAAAAKAAGVPSVRVEPSLSEGQGEAFFRSWGVPGADGTWGGPAGCGMGESVVTEELRPAARDRIGELVPLERLKQCPGSALAPVEETYEPFLPFSGLEYTWGRFESERRLEERMRAFFNAVARTNTGRTVMLVSHCGPVQALFRSVMRPERDPPCGYCALFAFSRRRGEGMWSAPLVPPTIPEIQPLPEERQPSPQPKGEGGVGEGGDPASANASSSGAAAAASTASGEEEDARGTTRLTEDMLQARTDEWEQMAEELFDRFDEDNDGFWNLREASRLLLTTTGVKMPEGMFVALLSGAASKRGAQITQSDLDTGLSKDEVIDIYTQPEMRKRFRGVLEVRRDHAIVMCEGASTRSCWQCGRSAANGAQGSGDFAGQWFCESCWQYWADPACQGKEAMEHGTAVMTAGPEQPNSDGEPPSDVIPRGAGVSGSAHGRGRPAMASLVIRALPQSFARRTGRK